MTTEGTTRTRRDGEALPASGAPAAAAVILALLVLVPAPPGTALAQSPATGVAEPAEAGVRPAGPPFVTSDVATLRTTLVLPVNEYIFKSSEMGQGMPFFSMGQPPGAIDEYRAMLELLEQAGVELLDVRDMLQEAIETARARGELAGAMRELFPAGADAIVERLDEVDADSLLFLRDDHVYLAREDGTMAPLFPGFSSMYWARDWAATVPAGVVIGNSRRFTRSLENRLARFLFEYAGPLQRFPVVFDAGEAGVNLDGGDLIVLDEETLLLGVDNRTSRDAAPALAEALGMEVLAVALPPWEERSGLARQLLHLDTTFNLVDTGTIVATPYFHEKRHSQWNPVARMLLGLARQAEAWDEVSEADELGGDNVDYIRRTVEQMPDVGRLTRYAAGTGEPEELDEELVDLFRGRDYRIVPVGGPAGDLPEAKWAFERAMYELRWQGANVVQLGPGRVIAFEHNLHTNRALREAGIEVQTFPGQLIGLRGGGPHCLLMPLVRRD